MSYPVGNIVPITATIQPSGLGFANFGSALLIAKNADLPAGFNEDTYRVYSSIKSLSADFANTTETYKSAAKRLSGVPASRSITIWGTNSGDSTITATLNKALDQLWWYWTFFTADIYADISKVEEIAIWHNGHTHEKFFVNCSTGAQATDNRDPTKIATCIAGVLTAAGYRNSLTFSHATDAYAGIPSSNWLSAVNFSQVNSTLTVFGKKMVGVVAEDLTDTAYNNMSNDLVRSAFYAQVELGGSVDNGRIINAKTHSSFGEYFDDVFNLAGFLNYLQVNLYNTIVNQTKKLGQDPQGQATLIGEARRVCELFIQNGYLGERNYTDPDDGQFKYTVGYEILTKPEDILNLLEADRDARKAEPLRIRIFRKGAIEQCAVDIEVY
jgi:hypothetical protein